MGASNVSLGNMLINYNMCNTEKEMQGASKVSFQWDERWKIPSSTKNVTIGMTDQL